MAPGRPAALLLAVLAAAAAVPAPAAEEPGFADIAGRVVDDRGDPIVDFPLRLEERKPPSDAAPRRRPFLAHALTGLEGEFRFTSVPKGTYRIQYNAGRRKGGFPQIAVDLPEEVSPGSTDLRIVVRTLRPISGKVTAPGGAAPPPGGRIEARGVREGNRGTARTQVVLGADGSFRTDPVDPNYEWLLSALEFEGFVEGPPVVARAGDAGVEVVLDPGGRLEGVVVDQNGNPVGEGYSVRARARERGGSGGGGKGTFALAKTDASGRFVLATLGDHEFGLEMHSSLPYGLGEERVEGSFRRGAEGVVVRITRHFQAFGVLLCADGEPMGTERVCVRAPGGKVGEFWFRTRANGSFDYPAPPIPRGEFLLYRGKDWVSLGDHDLPSTSLHLRAPPKGDSTAAATGTPRPRPVDPPGTKRIHGIRVSDGTIRGRVLRQGGEPIAGVLVSFFPYDERTDRPAETAVATTWTAADGTYESPVLPAGRYETRISGEGWRPESASAFTPATAHGFTMRPGLSVRGVVVDAATGAPVEGIEVFLYSTASADSAPPARTRPDGSFTVGHPPPGIYSLRVGAVRRPGLPALSQPGDYISRTLEGIENGTADLRVELVKGLAIDGTLVDGEGRPLAEAVAARMCVSLSTAGPDGPGHESLGATGVPSDGSFRFGSLVPGAYALQAEYRPGDEPGSFIPFDAVVHEAGSAGVRLRVPLGPPIEGRALGVNGEPAPGAEVRLIGEGANIQGSAILVAGPDGGFRTGILNGEWTYHLAHGPRGFAPGVALGLRAGATGVVLRPGPGAVLEGIVVDDLGLPLEEGVGVAASGAGEAPGERYFAQGSALTEPGGRFRIVGLLPERLYRVTVQGPGTDFLPSGDPLLVRPGVQGLFVRVARGVSLGGVLLDAAGKPVARTSLVAEPIREGTPWPSWYARSAFTDDAGRFLVRGLPRGEVRLAAIRKDGRLDLGIRRAPDEGLEVVLPKE